MRKLSEAEFNRAIGVKLCKLREAAGLTQAEVAEQLGIHTNTVSNYERGQGIPTIMLLKFCAITKANAAKVMAEVITNGGIQ